MTARTTLMEPARPVDPGGGLEAWEATPIATRRVWFTVGVRDALEAEQFDVRTLEWLVEQLEREGRVAWGISARCSCGVLGIELAIGLGATGRWLVSLASEVPV